MTTTTTQVVCVTLSCGHRSTTAATSQTKPQEYRGNYEGKTIKKMCSFENNEGERERERERCEHTTGFVPKKREQIEINQSNSSDRTNTVNIQKPCTVSVSSRVLRIINLQ